MFKKWLVLALAVTMTFSLAACSSKKENTEQPGQTTEESGTTEEVKASGQYDTLVVGVNDMNRVFSPFFYSSAYDNQIIEQVFSEIMELNASNELIPNAGNVTHEEIAGDNGEVSQVKYTVKLNEGMTFSDGKPVTIDDLLFTYYVYADPMYDGMSVFNSLDIDGLKEYYYDTPDYSDKMKEIEEQSKTVSDEEVLAVINASTDADMESYGAEYINDALGLGFDAAASDFKEQVREAYFEQNKADWDTYAAQAQTEKFSELKKGYITGNIEDGIDVESIKGIERVDDLTCTVLMNSVDINAERQLALVPIMPKHYYGVGADGKEFVKGDLSMAKEKNETPLGSGPFVYQGFDNNIVTLNANPNYFKGAPKFPNLKFQVVNENNKVDSVILGEIDITDPSASKEIMTQLDENGIEYSLVDNNGYGYIAINSDRIKDKNVRKGLMHLMNRKPAIESYYGELASVIERPMTTTLAEYPQDATEYYAYDPTKAAEYFEMAGYKKDASGKLVNEDGKQLRVEICISQLATHPSAAILTQMKTDMDTLGAEFVISDVDTNVLFDRMNNNDVDMWVAAWGNSNDCDLTQIFHSSKAGMAGANVTYLKDDKLDSLLTEVVKTVDLEERKKLVAEELEIIMDWAVYMPVYQRKNLVIYNPEVINMDTIPETTSPYWTYEDVMEMIELK